MDSDAVLQAIALGMPNIHVVRKDGPSPGTVLSIDKFMHALEQTFPGESNRVRLDFCALCLFRGNDYLRGMSVGLEKLWKAYLYTRLVDPVIQSRKSKFLIETDFKTFDLVFLRQLMLNSEIHPSELELRIGQVGIAEPVVGGWVGRAVVVEKEDEYGLESDKESVGGQSDGDDNIDAENSDSDSEPGVLESEDKEDEELDVKSYSVQKHLVGILWNLEMYCSGKCPDVAFVYEFQYAPPRRAITAYVTALAQTKGAQDLTPASTSKNLAPAKSDRQYLHPLVCALIVSCDQPLFVKHASSGSEGSPNISCLNATLLVDSSHNRKPVPPSLGRTDPPECCLCSPPIPNLRRDGAGRFRSQGDLGSSAPLQSSRGQDRRR